MLPWAHPSPEPKQHLGQLAAFAGPTTVTDRPTDHATLSVRIGRIYVCGTGMPLSKIYLVAYALHLHVC